MRSTSLRRLVPVTLLAVVAAVVAVLVPTPQAAHALSGPYGVDVSRFQHTSAYPTINWSQVKASGKSFVFVKATEGTTYTSPNYGDVYDARNAGLYSGAYHFARPSYPVRSDALAEADHFTDVIGDIRTANTLPPVLDLEDAGSLSQGDLVQWVQLFLERVRSNTGRAPIIYVSPSFWSSKMADHQGFQQYALWVAHYTSASSPIVPGGWKFYSFWQYSSSKTTPGISGGVGSVDQNSFNGGASQLASFANGTASQSWPTAAPDAPFSLRVASGSNGQATVRFVPGEDNGLAATSFRVSMSDGVGSRTLTDSTTTTFSGLTPGATYSVSVTASNGRGTSPAATTTFTVPLPSTATPTPTPTPSPSETVVPLAAPKLTATAGTEQVALSWSAVDAAATSVEVQRCAPAPCTPTDTVATPATTSRSWVDTTVEPGTAASYRLAVAGDEATTTPSVSNTATATPTYAPVPRLSGSTRVQTAVAVSAATWPKGATTAVLATANNWPDGLSAASLSRGQGPVLLTGSGGLDPAALAELKRVLPAGSTVYLMGGTSALSSAVYYGVRDAGFVPQRIRGADRFETAALAASTKVASSVSAAGRCSIVLAGAGNFADAVAASYLAAARPGILLFTSTTGMPTSERKVLSTCAAAAKAAGKPVEVDIVGGPAAKAFQAVRSSLGVSFTVTRTYSGVDRYDTSARVLRSAPKGLYVPGSGLRVGVAIGDNWPDALVGGITGPVVLTGPSQLPSSVAAALAARSADTELVRALGGSTVVPEPVARAAVTAAALD